MSKKKKQSKIELEEMNIILRIPKEAAALEVTALLVRGEKVSKASKKLTLSDIQEMRQNFLDNLEDDDYDAKYVLTDEGRAYLDQLMAN